MCAMEIQGFIKEIDYSELQFLEVKYCFGKNEIFSYRNTVLIPVCCYRTETVIRALYTAEETVYNP